MPHTPGPWEVRGCNPAFAFEGIKGKERLIGREVSLRGPGFARETCGQAAADAQLIEAAPGLLAALKELVSASYDSVNKKHFAPFQAEELAMANAAIAKAEGRDA